MLPLKILSKLPTLLNMAKKKKKKQNDNIKKMQNHETQNNNYSNCSGVCKVSLS